MSQYKLYAFLDVLGYKELLKADEQGNTEIFKDKLTAAFSTLNQYDQSEIVYKSISDSIFISFNDINEVRKFFSVIKTITIDFMKNGLLIRGGLAYNKHFENPTITYSFALTEAYNLEQEAEYPRILISNNTIQVLENLNLLENVKNMILLEGESYQLDILDEGNICEVAELVKKIYIGQKKQIDKNPRLRQKYIWLQSYLNYKRIHETPEYSFIKQFERYE